MWVFINNFAYLCTMKFVFGNKWEIIFDIGFWVANMDCQLPPMRCYPLFPFRNIIHIENAKKANPPRLFSSIYTDSIQIPIKNTVVQTFTTLSPALSVNNIERAHLNILPPSRSYTGIRFIMANIKENMATYSRIPNRAGSHILIEG